MNKSKMYLLIKTLRELAMLSKDKRRSMLKHKSDIIDQLFSYGIDNTIEYYKNRLEVLKNGNNGRKIEKD